MKHREEKQLQTSIKTILRAPEVSVKNLPEETIREEIRKIRRMADE